MQPTGSCERKSGGSWWNHVTSTRRKHLNTVFYFSFIFIDNHAIVRLTVHLEEQQQLYITYDTAEIVPYSGTVATRLYGILQMNADDFQARNICNIDFSSLCTYYRQKRKPTRIVISHGWKLYQKQSLAEWNKRASSSTSSTYDYSSLRETLALHFGCW